MVTNKRGTVMTDERISEVETKLYTHEGRIKATEVDVRQIVGNIDRIEDHMIRSGDKPINYGAIASVIVAFLSVMGTAVFGITNYVDQQLQHVKDSRAVYEMRVMENSAEVDELNGIIHDRLGRLEERSRSLEEDVRQMHD
jgi:hypothetical protein